MTRSAEGQATWEQARAARKYALEPLRVALVREGRAQTWLQRQLENRLRMTVKTTLLRAYLHGYARIPRDVLSAACWIAGITERDITARIADADVLFQATKTGTTPGRGTIPRK